MKLILQRMKRIAFNLEESLGDPPPHPQPPLDKRKDMRQWHFLKHFLLLLQTGSGKQVNEGKTRNKKANQRGRKLIDCAWEKREKGADALLIKKADASVYRTWLPQMICRTFSFCCSSVWWWMFSSDQTQFFFVFFFGSHLFPYILVAKLSICYLFVLVLVVFFY